jgi:rhamnulokinase
MSTPHYFAACDLGAESGRVMLGTLQDGRLELEEIHRFLNLPVDLGGTLRWDAIGLFREMKIGLGKIGQRGLPLTSLSVDTWGVDYAWQGANQPLLAPPVVYRDPRNDSAMTELLSQLSREEIFAETGLQFMPFNTIFQLFADHRHSPAMVQASERFLLLADFYNYLFSGRAVAEESLASTTQLYHPGRKQWSEKLIATCGLRREVFPPIVPSGTVLGPLRQQWVDECFLPGAKVVATCSHDTGAAVAAVPARPGNNWAYLSSGTWSLLGVELPSPLLEPAVLEANFTNEGGYGGSTRFLKNIVGLWILQECRRSWEAAGHHLDYSEITRLATAATPLRSLLNPDDPRFLKPGQMPEKIAAFCQETAQPVPEDPGSIARCILESLALTYRAELEVLEKITLRHIEFLHIVGGGSRNALLSQLAANATGRTILAGPVEATAIGNLLIQAIAAGALQNLHDLRETVARSFPLETFQPAKDTAWENAWQRFQKLRA